MALPNTDAALKALYPGGKYRPTATLPEGFKLVKGSLTYVGSTAVAPADKPATAPKATVTTTKPGPTFFPQQTAAAAPSFDIGALFPQTQDTAVGFGFPLLEATTNLILKANAERRAGIQQAVDVARLMSETERVSPTRAASIATYLGIPSKIDLGFANIFGRGLNLGASTGGRFTGNIGGQDVSVPGSLSGQELSFLGANPNVANVLSDVAGALGNPDLISRSMATRIPFSPSLLGVAQ